MLNIFYQCSNLTSVTIGSGVTSIGKKAFSGCGGLTSVTIPNSVTSIGENAFSGCNSLTSVNISDIEAWCRISFDLNPFYYAYHLYLTGEEVKDLIIPNSVTSIGNYTFRYSSLTSVTIPNSVTSIGDQAFSNCVSLTSVTIPNSVTSIGSSAFSGCSGLTSITIPNSVRSIDDWTFYFCSGLTSVTIGNSVTSIGEYAFSYCSNLTSVTIGSVVTSIGRWAFENCTSLTSVTIPNSVTSIGENSFSGCYGLTSITIPSSVIMIGRNAFDGCSGLTSVIVGKGVKSIGNAFYNCNNLQEMILSQTAYDNGIPACVTKFTTYSKNPMRVVVTSKGATSATMKIYPIDDSGNTNEDNCYTVTMQGLEPGQYIKWKLDDENYGIISEKASSLTLLTQSAQPTSTTKARLTATVNEADDDQHFGFEWLRNDAPNNMPANKVSAPLYEGRIIGSLSGLNPDIYYKYRPFYQADSGEMYYGEWIAFLTGDANVFFEPETHTKEVTEVTSASAQLAGVWIEGTEDIEEKGFEYWTVSGVNTRVVGKDARTVVVSGNKTVVTIEGLIPGKNYGYRSYIKTVSGTTYGEEKTFKTVLAGDVNGDGVVNDADVKDVVSHIMGMTPKEFNKEVADVNKDNKVNSADIVLINKIINKK